MTLLSLALLAQATASVYAVPSLKADLPGHTDKVTSVAFAADGGTLLTASADHTVRVWDTSSGAPLRTLSSAAPLFGLALQDPSGSRAYAAGGAWARTGDHDVYSFDTARSSTRSAPLETLEGHTGAVLGLSVSPDGKLLASASKDGTVRLWNTGSDERADLISVSSPISAASFSKGGLLLFAPSDRTLRIYDPKLQRQIEQLTFAKNVLVLLCSRGSRDLLVAASASGEVRVLEVGGGIIASFPGDGAPLTALAFDAEEEVIFATTQAGDVRQLSLELQASSPLLTGVKARSVAASPRGHLLAVGTTDGRTLLYALQKVALPLVLDPQAHTGQVMDLEFTPDGKELVSVSKDKSVRVWEVASGENVRTLRGFAGPGDDGQLYRLAISPDGREVAVAGFLGTSNPLVSPAVRQDPSYKAETIGHLRVMSLQTGKVRGVVRRGTNSVTSLAWGRRFVSGNMDRLVRTYDAANFEKAVTRTKPSIHSFQLAGPVLLTALSPDGNHVVASEFSGTSPMLFDVSTLSAQGVPRAVVSLKGKHASEVVAAAFSPDGALLVTADQDHAFLWSPAGDFKGEFAGKFRLAADSKIAFSRDGKLLVLGAKVFAFPSGKELSTLEDATLTVKASAFRGSDLIASCGPRHGSSGEGDTDVVLWDPLTGKVLRRLAPKARKYNGVAFLSGGLGIALTDEYGVLAKTFSPEQLQTGFDFERLRIAKPSAPASNGLVFEAGGKTLRRPGPVNGKESLGQLKFGEVMLEDKVSGASVWAYTLLPDGTALVGTNLHLRSYDAAGAERKRFVGHAGQIKALALSSDGKLLASLGDDFTVRLWKLDDPGVEVAGRRVVRPLVSLFLSTDGEWIAWGEDSTYASSRHGGRYLGFLLNQGREKEARFYPFEQYDLRLNRPDLLLTRLGVGSAALRQALAHAWKKRVKRMGFTVEALQGELLDLPKVLLRTTSRTTTERTLELDFTASSATLGLDRLQVYVNDVPTLGRAGLPLNGVHSIDKKLSVPLSTGRNRIQVSVLDTGGNESPRETLQVRCDAPQARPTLYLVAIGVSHYKDAQYDLTYAGKDAKNLAELLSSKQAGYKDAKVLLLDDAKVTREAVLKAREFLAQSGVDDEAVVFFAGHGLLDSQLDYYLATTDVDFNSPAGRGLAYEELEGLLDGIPARRRLVLIDACNSGEVDKEEVVLTTAAAPGPAAPGVKSRGFKQVKASTVGLQGSFELVQELFADLRRTSGAAVISSASGKEFAFESAKWNNGVFTFALLDGLKSGAADGDQDGTVKVSELRDFVIDRVQKLTSGQQTPTSRRENLEFDFPVFVTEAGSSKQPADAGGGVRK